MRHRFSPIIFFVLVSVIIGSRSVAHSATPELRGTWVTTTGLSGAGGTIKDPGTTAANFKKLRDIGLNSVYMDAWRNGYTQFPSATMQATIGVAKDPLDASRDLLQETLIQAHRNGIAEVAWFQYGFSSGYGPFGLNSLSNDMKNQGWLLQDQAGGYYGQSNSFYWMNPAVPQVRTFLTNVVLDAVKKYDLDGVQFDDRLAWPINYGWDAATRTIYKNETGRDLPTDPNDSLFKAWRAQKVTDFAKQLYIDLKKANPKLIVSAAPGVYPYVYDTYCVNWPTWSKTSVTLANGQTRPLFDEFVPQVYSSTASYFTGEWSNQRGYTNQSRLGQEAVGISINGSSGAYDWTTVTKPQLDSARASWNNGAGTAGHALWYSEGVLNNDAAQLTSYYNVASLGQAPRPDQPSNYRPPPIVASKIGTTTQWTASIASKYRYEVVTNINGTWSELTDSVYFPGTLSVNVSGASSVEVLLDQRPFIDGDANLDGAVDLSDFTTLAVNFNGSGKSWATGDFSGDAGVDLTDFTILAAHFNQSVSTMPDAAPAAAVPEPQVIVLLSIAAILNRRFGPRMDTNEHE